MRPSSRARCARSRTCACAMWQPLAGIWRTAIRTWTCRRCSSRSARACLCRACSARGARRGRWSRALMATKIMERGQVGRSVARLEGQAKVTGRAEYTHNLRLPGMLYGKIFRSTVAHGRILSVDVSEARALAGVHRVVTIDDVRKIVPNPYYGPAFHD